MRKTDGRATSNRLLILNSCSLILYYQNTDLKGSLTFYTNKGFVKCSSSRCIYENYCIRHENRPCTQLVPKTLMTQKENRLPPSCSISPVVTNMQCSDNNVVTCL